MENVGKLQGAQAYDFSEVASVARSFRVIEELAGSREGLTVGELSRSLSLGKSSVSRILSTLEPAGYVVRDAAGRFHLTFRFTGLAYRYLDILGFPAFASPVLNALAKKHGELVELAVVEQDELRFVASANAAQRVRVHPLLGETAPLKTTASGWAWLAFVSPSEVERLLGVGGDGRSRQEIKELQPTLEVVRKRGYAVSRGGADPGASALAAPIRPAHAGHRVVGTVALVVPQLRFSEERLQRAAPDVLEAAETLAQTWPTHLAPAIE